MSEEKETLKCCHYKEKKNILVLFTFSPVYGIYIDFQDLTKVNNIQSDSKLRV